MCSLTPNICSLSISFTSSHPQKHSLKALNKMSKLFAHPQNECLLPSHKNNHTLFNTTWNDGWCERGMMLWTIFAKGEMEASLVCLGVQIIDMYRFPIWALQIRWRVRHFGMVNLTSFTVIINEYSRTYMPIICCCRGTQSTCAGFADRSRNGGWLTYRGP